MSYFVLRYDLLPYLGTENGVIVYSFTEIYRDLLTVVDNFLEDRKGLENPVSDFPTQGWVRDPRCGVILSLNQHRFSKSVTV